MADGNISRVSTGLREEESETPSGIQSDTPERGDTSSELPTRDVSGGGPTLTSATTQGGERTLTSGSTSQSAASQERHEEGPAELIEDAVAEKDGEAANDGPPTIEEASETAVEDAEPPSEMEIDGTVTEDREEITEKSEDREAITEKSEAIGEEEENEELSDARQDEEEGKSETVTADEGREDKDGVVDDEISTEKETHEENGDESKGISKDIPIESLPGYLPWDKDAEMISRYQERMVRG